jgi:hypothetical protein
MAAPVGCNASFGPDAPPPTAPPGAVPCAGDFNAHPGLTEPSSPREARDSSASLAP